MEKIDLQKQILSLSQKTSGEKALLKIQVTAGTGEGKTSISAFDKALAKAGIANYNLIYLSSIVPQNSTVRVKNPKPQNPALNKLNAFFAGSNQKLSSSSPLAIDFGLYHEQLNGFSNQNGNEYGKKLYVVMSRCDQDICGKEAWAGLGWVQDNSGRGLFVEHKGENRATVIKLINDSLSDMKRSRPYQYGPVQYSVTGIKCTSKAVCAVVVAVYKSESW